LLPLFCHSDCNRCKQHAQHMLPPLALATRLWGVRWRIHVGQGDTVDKLLCITEDQ
jgi:hypothetical protein